MCSHQDSSLTELEERQLIYLRDTHDLYTIQFESLWHFVELDPIQEDLDRDDQIAFVCRQGHQDWDGLEELSVVRFRHRYNAIIRQLEKEADASRKARAEYESK